MSLTRRESACIVASYHGIPETDEDLNAYVREVARRPDDEPGWRELLIDAFIELGYNPVVVAEAFGAPVGELERA